MADHEHLIERRARVLGEAITARTELLKNALLPPGSRPPFTKQLSESDALAFWQRNRHTDIGRQVLKRMKIEDIMELDLALAQMSERTGGSDGL